MRITTDPRILVRHIPAFLPQCEVITRLMAADVRLLDVYAAWCALDSNVFLGVDGSEKVTQFSLPLDYIKLHDEKIIDGTLQTDGPSVFDMEVLPQRIGSRQTTVEVLERMLEYSYGHMEHFAEVRDKYVRLVEESFQGVEDNSRTVWGRLVQEVVETRLRLSVFNTGLLQHLYHDLIGRPLECVIPPVAPHNLLTEGDQRIIRTILWAKRKYPSLEYYLVGWIGTPGEMRLVLQVEEVTGLNVIRMNYTPPEGFSETSSIGLLMKNGWGVDPHANLNLGAVSFERLRIGQRVELFDNSEAGKRSFWGL